MCAVQGRGSWKWTGGGGGRGCERTFDVSAWGATHAAHSTRHQACQSAASIQEWVRGVWVRQGQLRLMLLQGVHHSGGSCTAHAAYQGVAAVAKTLLACPLYSGPAAPDTHGHLGGVQTL